MKVLVTGATGFLGKRVLPLLRKQCEARVFARVTSDTALARSLGCEVVQGDLDRPESLRDALLGCDGLISLASLGFGHADGVVWAAEEAAVKRAVFVGTTSVFTRLPAATKPIRVAAEQRIFDSRLEWVLLRPTMIYGGPDDRNMVRLLRFLRTAPVVPIPGRGQALLQPVHVEDLAAGVVAAFFATDVVRRSFELSGLLPQTFEAVIDDACAALGVRPLKVHLPLRPVSAAVRLFSRLTKRVPFVSEEQIQRLAEDKAFDHTAACEAFGFAPRPFAQGIRQEARLLK